MVEQAERLSEFGVNAAFVGELQKESVVNQKVSKGDVEVVLITPESILESQWREVLCSVTYRRRVPRASEIGEKRNISIF